MLRPQLSDSKDSEDIAMAKASDITGKVTLRYASHEFEPVEMMDFIQLDGFKRSWQRLKLTEEDLWVLRTMIAAAPLLPPVVPGTGGLRKIRFKDPKSNRGKSGGYRVCYAYFNGFGIVLLMAIYRKGRKDNLTKSECNNIREELGAFEQSLQQKPLC